jgi:hypothetical protein
MQDLLEKRAKNREKQRIWRQKNLEKSRELKRKSNWKARGGPPKPREHVFIKKEPKSPREPKPISIQAFGTRIDPADQIEVSLCMNCYRKYLPKLYCLWCNDKNYGTR